VKWIDSWTAGPYGCFMDTIEFTGVPSLQLSLSVVSAFATATDYALPLPVRWPYLLYCLDDRALRRHIHSIPPQYTLH
jgi:hypothetical protein